MRSGDCGLRERLAEQESRADLRTEMAGLDWFLGVVDLRLLLAFQRRIVLDSEAQEAPVPTADDWVGLMSICASGGRSLLSVMLSGPMHLWCFAP